MDLARDFTQENGIKRSGSLKFNHFATKLLFIGGSLCKLPSSWPPARVVGGQIRPFWLKTAAKPARTCQNFQNRPAPEITGNNRACSRNTRAIYGPPGALHGPNMANTRLPLPKKTMYTDYIWPYIRTIYSRCTDIYRPITGSME